MGKTELITIYHNQSCSKSCNALEVLKQSGKTYEVVEYLADVPTIEDLKTIVAKLKCKPHELIRTNEKVYIAQFKGKDLTDEEWIVAMHENPILIQRPILITRDKGIIARTPEALDNFQKS
ncbi:arsenate reductase family protein [Pedobacter sp. Hv1]|uniref:arsenate reductase family protein n=1 Tax=Pedobacter sp. Hv1 TaxID=1740090 RepID=UPI0006D8C86C|nr:arsenate reductase family protein [Pedobacter sp. Hv1]KQC02325.1 hypothetical protein AQF98_01735 [Pedobacter sp. Hv1]